MVLLGFHWAEKFQLPIHLAALNCLLIIIIVADEQMKRLEGHAYTRQDEEYFDYRHWSTGDAEHDSKHIMDFLKACEVEVSQDTAARVVYEKVDVQRLIAVVPTERRAFRRGPREAEVYTSLSRRTLYDDKPSVLMTHTRPYISVSVMRGNLQFDNVRKAVDLMASLFHQ